MLKHDSASRLSKLKKSTISAEKSLKLSIRDWRKSKSKDSVEMELLTELPVPTVPPYPIEYFEESENGLSHINMAFKFSEECLPPTVAKESKFNSMPRCNRDETNDNESKSSSEDSRESVGGSTADSGVVLHSSQNSRTSGSSNDFRTSPDGRDEREVNAELMRFTGLKNGSANNAYDHYSRSQAISYPTYPLRPGQSHSRSASGSTHPISNGTLKHTADQTNKIRTRPITHSESNSGNYQDLRGRIPVPVHRPPVRVSSMPPNIKEHIYVNRPPLPAPPIDGCGPPPYPGTSNHFRFGGFPPNPQVRAEPPPQTHPHLGSQIRSHLWQASATPKPCGRSKSVHGEHRKVDPVRSRLGSINTLGIPYQTTLPARLHKKIPFSVVPRIKNDAMQRSINNLSKKPDIILTLPINKVKMSTQPSSPFKKSLVPVYSKVCKQRKQKKVSNSGSDNMTTKLLPNPKNPPHSYSTIEPKPINDGASSKNTNKSSPSSSAPKTQTQPGPLAIRCRSEDGLANADGTSVPLYEELLHLHDDDEEENGQYSIEVRIDYSKGTKYKVEKRRRNRSSQDKSDSNNNNDNEDQTDGTVNNNVLNDTKTSVNSDKLNQFRRNKKNSLCSKLRNKSDVKNLKNGFAGKLRTFSFCCCR